MSKAKLTTLDPEPPVGTVVRAFDGVHWQRVEAPISGTYWIMVRHPEGDPESWIKVAGNYGPVTVISHG